MPSWRSSQPPCSERIARDAFTQQRDPRSRVENLIEIDPIQEIREHRLLPSDLLDMAQRNNPDVRLSFDYEWSGPMILVVATKRGKVTYRREDHEDWHAVFVRTGLLRRR